MRQEFLPLAECITLDTLPSVPVAASQTLPREGGIYFVVDGQGEVQYIGRTNNLAVRWMSHHRLQQYRKEDGYRISWLTVSNTTLLPAIERACIAYFAPVDNGAMIPGGAVGMKTLTIRLPDDVHDQLLIYAKTQHRSLQGQVRLLIERELEEHPPHGSGEHQDPYDTPARRPE